VQLLLLLLLQAGTRLRPHHLEQFVYHHMQLGDAAGDALLPQLPAALSFIEEGRRTGDCLRMHSTTPVI
jgi:hypothetical protein